MDENQLELSPVEAQIIMNYGVVRDKAEKHLPSGEWARIAQLKETLHGLVRLNGDAGRVAVQLFFNELCNTEPPYGETFTILSPIPFNEALAYWAKGHAEAEGK